MAADHHGREAAEDISVPYGFTTEEWKAYEKRWSRELPGNPATAFIGIALALALFLFMAVMPGLMDWMQDEGIIKPRIHLRPIMGVKVPEMPDPLLPAEETAAPEAQDQPGQRQAEEPAPQPAEDPRPADTAAPFGSPRQD